jgi:amino-acid N-acetyltransferase
VIVGAIGLERYDHVGLLRSLVVAASARHRGIGRELVATVEREARRAGVGVLVLLTETAETFFAQLGYAVVRRAEVPEPVKQSAEFAALCPGSAVCMSNSVLAGGEGSTHV